MAKLCRAELAQEKNGKGSGYLTLETGEEITMTQVLEALGAPHFPALALRGCGAGLPDLLEDGRRDG